LQNIGNVVGNLEDLQNSVIPNIVYDYMDPVWLTEQTILASRNEAVDAANREILDTIPGISKV
jgi:hypothetical protein